VEYIADMSYETKPVEKLSTQLRTSSLDDSLSVPTARPNSDTVDLTPLDSYSHRNDPESAPAGTDISAAAGDSSVPSLLRTYSLETRTTNPSEVATSEARRPLSVPYSQAHNVLHPSLPIYLPLHLTSEHAGLATDGQASRTLRMYNLAAPIGRNINDFQVLCTHQPSSRETEPTLQPALQPTGPSTSIVSQRSTAHPSALPPAIPSGGTGTHSLSMLDIVSRPLGQSTSESATPSSANSADLPTTQPSRYFNSTLHGTHPKPSSQPVNSITVQPTLTGKARSDLIVEKRVGGLRKQTAKIVGSTIGSVFFIVIVGGIVYVLIVKMRRENLARVTPHLPYRFK
jgi:hypothetical protein